MSRERVAFDVYSNRIVPERKATMTRSAVIQQIIDDVDALQARIDADKGRVSTMTQEQTEEQKIAWLLGLDARDLAQRISLNAATMRKSKGEFVSLQINREDGSLHAMSDTPSGVAAAPKALTKEAISDVKVFDEIEWALGLAPGTLAERLREEKP